MKFCENCGNVTVERVSAATLPNNPLDESPSASTAATARSFGGTSFFFAANHTEARSDGMWLNLGYTPGEDSF